MWGEPAHLAAVRGGDYGGPAGALGDGKKVRRISRCGGQPLQGQSQRKAAPKSGRAMRPPSKDGRRRSSSTRLLKKFLVTNGAGEKRTLKAEDREALMGYKKGHTLSMLKKVPESDEELASAEVLRCAWKFVSRWSGGLPCVGLAGYLGSARGTVAPSHSRGVPGRLEADRPVCGCPRGGPTRASCLQCSARGGAESSHETCRGTSDGRQPARAARQRSTKLTEQYLRQGETGPCLTPTPARVWTPRSGPGAFARATAGWGATASTLWRCRHFLNAVRWRCRKGSFHSHRFLHLLDSEVVLAVGIRAAAAPEISTSSSANLLPCLWPQTTTRCLPGLRVPSTLLTHRPGHDTTSASD